MQKGQLNLKPHIETEKKTFQQLLVKDNAATDFLRASIKDTQKKAMNSKDYKQ